MRVSCSRLLSPRQYAPATLCSLNALILPVRRDVRAAAQVGEIALAVDGDGLLAGTGQLVDDLVLEPLVLAVQEFFGLPAARPPRG